MRHILLIILCWFFHGVTFASSLPAPPESIAKRPVDIFAHVEELPRLKFGSGKTNVIIVVDPLCPHCKSVLSEIHEYSKSHKFHIILVGVLGPASSKAARLLFCNPNKAIDLMVRGDRQRIFGLPECKSDMLSDFDARSERAAWMMSAWKMTSVPVIITETGIREDGAAPLADILHK